MQQVLETKPGLWARAKARALKVGDNILHWRWTRQVVHWLIYSAGTMSELAFLVASLWVSVNSNVHKFVLTFIPENTTQHFTDFATTAYVALPELIVGLAVVTTIGHIKTWRYSQDWKPAIWAILFGLPTFVFIILSVITLGNAVVNNTFEMPALGVITRAEAGFMFAFCSLLYTFIGKDQEKERLEKKDAKIAGLNAELNAKTQEWSEEIARLNAVIADQKAVFEKTKRQKENLENAVLQSAEDALGDLSPEVKNWLLSEPKSIKQEEITEKTGHSKTKINNALANKKLKNPPNSKELILKKSVAEWLRENPPTKDKIFVLKNQNTEEIEAI